MDPEDIVDEVNLLEVQVVAEAPERSTEWHEDSHWLGNEIHWQLDHSG